MPHIRRRSRYRAFEFSRECYLLITRVAICLLRKKLSAFHIPGEPTQMQVEANRGPIEELDVQALAVAVFKDEKAGDGFLKKLDELSGGLVSSAIEAEEFCGKEGETAYFHLVGNDKLKSRRLLLVGVGEQKDYRSPQVSQMAGTAVRSLRSKKVKTIGVVPRLSDN